MVTYAEKMGVRVDLFRAGGGDVVLLSKKSPEEYWNELSLTLKVPALASAIQTAIGYRSGTDLYNLAEECAEAALRFIIDDTLSKIANTAELQDFVIESLDDLEVKFVDTKKPKNKPYASLSFTAVLRHQEKREDYRDVVGEVLISTYKQQPRIENLSE
ncbi:MAG: hypothetical protein H6774_04130 [Pseudomonadales bacterium]|nr:hypothetical protein [Candidatus Woesebacteria bacterium]MCB9802249.1 hypothetical protein [Pseudomonadales bacterium]